MTNTNRGNVLLRTIHGSSLYGLNHADSDEDWYTVTEFGPSKQEIVTIDGKTTDSVVIGLDAFLKEVNKGTHQAIETLHSRKAQYRKEWKPFFTSFRTYSPQIEETYDRVIRHLTMEDSFKRRRHGYRCALTLKDLRKYGKFNPTLSQKDIATINWLASEELYQNCTDTAHHVLDWIGGRRARKDFIEE